MTHKDSEEPQGQYLAVLALGTSKEILGYNTHWMVSFSRRLEDTPNLASSVLVDHTEKGSGSDTELAG